MKRRIIFLLPGALLLHSACPTEEPPQPPRLEAPVITGIEIKGELITGEYKEVVEIRWRPPAQDSVGIASYALLLCEAPDSAYRIYGNMSDCDDSEYVVVNYAIAANETRFRDRADRIGFPLPSTFDAYKPLRYRIYAIDVLGRNGDTSAPALITLAPQPRNFRLPDSTDDRRFSWEILGVLTRYFTQLQVWRTDSGLVWASRADTTYGGELAIPHTVFLPDSILPLPSGTYFCGARLEVVLGNDQPQSITIADFTVP